MSNLFGPNNELISMRQAQEGLLFLFDRINREYEWEALYEGDFSRLFGGDAPTSGDDPQIASRPRNDTIENAKAFFPDRRDIRTVNLFKLASEFYQRAVLSERPNITSQDPNMTKWLEENVEDIYRTLERAVRLWSVKDKLILLVDADGTLMAIDPSDYFRVSKPYNRESLVGHVIMTRWYDPLTEGSLLTPYTHRYPNRITVIRMSEVPEEDVEYNDVTTYEFTPSQLTGRVGQKVTANSQGRGYEAKGVVAGPEEANIKGILVVGDGQSWYPDVERVAETYFLQLSNTFRLFNIDSNRIQWLPQDALGPRVSGKDKNDVQARADEFRKQIRPVVVSQGAEGKPPSLDNFNPLGEYMEFVSYLEELFRKGAGVPEDAWKRIMSSGGAQGTMSGAAIERSEDQAAVRIRRVRTGISAGLPNLIKQMSGIEADVEVEWAHSPFEDKTKRREQARQDFQAGAITLEEYRHELGYDDSRITNEQRAEFTQRLSSEREQTRQASLNQGQGAE